MQQAVPVAYCPRCESDERVVVPWRGYRIARRAWFVVMGAVVAFAPILSFDYIVMTPTALAITVAIGPLNHLAAVPPTCRRCGYAYDRPEMLGTGLARRMLAPLRAAAARHRRERADTAA